MTGKEAKGFFKDKFIQSLRKDIVFWISTLAGVLVAITYYIVESSWHLNFFQFVLLNWPIFAFWVGGSFLLTRNFSENKNLKSHHLKSSIRVFLFMLVTLMPLTLFIVLPVLGVWLVIKNTKKTYLNDEQAENSKQPISKRAVFSLICSGIAVPLLFGITMIQGMLINSGVIHRRDALAGPGIGLLIGIIFAAIGIILWGISRKQEGRHVWNFWAMRLIIVNVILAPFVLFFVFAVAITRAK